MEISNTKIGFVGAGRVGCSLGRYFKENGLGLTGYYSRTYHNAKEAADFTNSISYESLEKLIEDSDIVFITVSDGAISQVAESIVGNRIKNKIFCHCSGALSSAVFSGIEKAGGFGYSVHPIFAINDKQNSYKELSKAYFTIEGNEAHIDQLAALFEGLGNSFQIISKDNKTKYHSAAVMASNLVIGLYQVAVDTLTECGFDNENAARALLPLFMNNANNIEKYGAAKALTGPVDRADEGTVCKHLDVLDEEKEIIYKALSRQIIKVATKKYADDEEKLEKLTLLDQRLRE